MNPKTPRMVLISSTIWTPCATVPVAVQRTSKLMHIEGQQCSQPVLDVTGCPAHRGCPNQLHKNALHTGIAQPWHSIRPAPQLISQPLIWAPTAEHMQRQACLVISPHNNYCYLGACVRACVRECVCVRACVCVHAWECECECECE